MYSVLKNVEHGTYTAVSQYSSWYITMMRSGMYVEILTGTKRTCDAWIEENTEPE